MNSRVNALRPSSSSSDPSILHRRDFSVLAPEEAPRNACGQQLRRSALSSRELGTSASVSGEEPSALRASPLTDPAFHRDLLHALDKLRGMIATIERQLRPASGGRGTVTLRASRFFRRLESSLAEELPAGYADARALHRNDHASTASWSLASSSSGHGERHSARPQKKRHCLPVLGGAPFVVCGACEELLQAPTSTVPSRRGGNIRLRCGGCYEVLELTLPTAAGIARGEPKPQGPDC